MSTKGTAFSLQNWGGQTFAYYKSISKRSADELEDIVAGALCTIATTPNPLDTSFDSQAFLGHSIAADPRSQMCKLSALFTHCLHDSQTNEPQDRLSELDTPPVMLEFSICHYFFVHPLVRSFLFLNALIDMVAPSLD